MSPVTPPDRLLGLAVEAVVRVLRNVLLGVRDSCEVALGVIPVAGRIAVAVGLGDRMALAVVGRARGFAFAVRLADEAAGHVVGERRHQAVRRGRVVVWIGGMVLIRRLRLSY